MPYQVQYRHIIEEKVLKSIRVTRNQAGIIMYQSADSISTSLTQILQVQTCYVRTLLSFPSKDQSGTRCTSETTKAENVVHFVLDYIQAS